MTTKTSLARCDYAPMLKVMQTVIVCHKTTVALRQCYFRAASSMGTIIIRAIPIIFSRRTDALFQRLWRAAFTLLLWVTTVSRNTTLAWDITIEIRRDYIPNVRFPVVSKHIDVMMVHVRCDDAFSRSHCPLESLSGLYRHSFNVQRTDYPHCLMMV